MTAEELLVQRFMQMEQKNQKLEAENEDLQDEFEKLQEELADFENLVHILSKYINVTKYGVSFELKTYIENEKADIEYLANFFDVEFKEETQGDNG